MKPGHTYWSQGPIVERHIATSITSPADVLRVSSRILAPLINSYCIQTVTRWKQTYINFHGFFDDAWDADRTLSKNRYSTRRNQRTIREKTVISHDFFRCFGHTGSKDLDSLQGGRFLRACECSARESAMLKLEKRGENGASQKGRGRGRGERRENACSKTLWKWETLGKISRAWPLFRKWIVDQSTHRVQRRCVCR